MVPPCAGTRIRKLKGLRQCGRLSGGVEDRYKSFQCAVAFAGGCDHETGVLLNRHCGAELLAMSLTAILCVCREWLRVACVQALGIIRH